MIIKKFLAILLVITLTVTLFAGCSKKDAIVGTWKDENDIVRFSDGGSFSASYYWMGGRYTVNGDSITLSPTLLDNEEYTFHVENNKLSLCDKDSGKEIYLFEEVK